MCDVRCIIWPANSIPGRAEDFGFTPSAFWPRIARIFTNPFVSIRAIRGKKRRHTLADHPHRTSNIRTNQRMSVACHQAKKTPPIIGSVFVGYRVSQVSNLRLCSLAALFLSIAAFLAFILGTFRLALRVTFFAAFFFTGFILCIA